MRKVLAASASFPSSREVIDSLSSLAEKRKKSSSPCLRARTAYPIPSTPILVSDTWILPTHSPVLEVVLVQERQVEVSTGTKS